MFYDDNGNKIKTAKQTFVEKENNKYVCCTFDKENENKICKIIYFFNEDLFNVEDISGMFGECEFLISLDIRNFDTRNVKSMEGMFCNM